MKMINYPKTRQFRDVVRDISFKATFVGLDENNQPIFDGMKEKPKILFKGSVKLHGTNAGLSYDGETIQVQSRNRIINSLQGHMGFAEFVHANKDWLKDMFDLFHKEGTITTVYGEWVGPSVQKGVAISELEQKMWFVFGVKVTPSEGDAYWLQSYELPKTNDRVWDLWEMTTYELEIDFERPQLATEHLVNITEQVEKECPIAKGFGISGVGEGVVWVGWYKGERHIFKVKGEKHSSSKVKKLAQVDPEKMKSIYDFVDYAATENRVDQAMKEVSDGNIMTLSKSNTGDVLRWIANDVISEESDTMQSNGITWDDVGRMVSDRARRIFFEKLENTFA